MEMRGQLVSQFSPPPPWGFWDLNLGQQGWQQVFYLLKHLAIPCFKFS